MESWCQKNVYIIPVNNPNFIIGYTLFVFIVFIVGFFFNVRRRFLCRLFRFICIFFIWFWMCCIFLFCMLSMLMWSLFFFIYLLCFVFMVLYNEMKRWMILTFWPKYKFYLSYDYNLYNIQYIYFYCLLTFPLLITSRFFRSNTSLSPSRSSLVASSAIPHIASHPVFKLSSSLPFS